MIKTQEVYICDFCGKTQHEVAKIIAGPKHPILGQLCICDECVELCNEQVYEAREKVDLSALRIDADRYRALRNASSDLRSHVRVVCTEKGSSYPIVATPELCDAAADLLIANQLEKNHGL